MLSVVATITLSKIFKDFLITSSQKTITQLPLITSSVIDVLKDIDNLNDHKKSTVYTGTVMGVGKEWTDSSGMC